MPVLKKFQLFQEPSDAPIPRRSGYTSKPANTSHSSAIRYLRDEDEERPLKMLEELVPAKCRSELYTNISGKGRPSSRTSIPLSGIRVQRDLIWKETQ
jgi:hypothetical protein